MSHLGIESPTKPEVLTMADILADLQTAPEPLDWFFVSPAARFGAMAPGEARGTYRTGTDVLLTDDQGDSEISGADFALAFVDEIDEPGHHRSRFTVAH